MVTNSFAASRGVPKLGTPMRRITSFTVAAAAGVSQSTVSRALSGDPTLDAETVRRVVDAATALEYVAVAAPIEPPAVTTTRRIAMVVDHDNPLWPLLVPPLHTMLAGRGYELSLVTGHAESEDVQRTLLGGGVDGVILTTVALDSPLPVILQRLGIPAVLLQRYADGGELDSSVANDFSGGVLAAQLLVDAGHTHIAALFGPEDSSTGRDRAEGFREQLASAGVPLDERWVRVGDFSYAHGYDGFDELLAKDPAPTALFCADDSIAFGALNRAHELGIRVPQDLTVIGFDDLEQSSWPTIGLTTVKVPFEDLLHSAITMLLDRIAGWKGGGRRVVHSVHTVERTSHAGAPTVERPSLPTSAPVRASRQPTDHLRRDSSSLLRR